MDEVRPRALSPDTHVVTAVRLRVHGGGARLEGVAILEGVEKVRR